jgi:hypothetical protein
MLARAAHVIEWDASSETSIRGAGSYFGQHGANIVMLFTCVKGVFSVPLYCSLSRFGRAGTEPNCPGNRDQYTVMRIVGYLFIGFEYVNLLSIMQ